MPFAQEPKDKGKLLRRSVVVSSVDAVRVSAKDGESYAEILKALKAKVNPQNSGARSSPSEERGGRRSFWSTKSVVTSRPSRRRLIGRSGRRSM